MGLLRALQRLGAKPKSTSGLMSRLAPSIEEGVFYRGVGNPSYRTPWATDNPLAASEYAMDGANAIRDISARAPFVERFTADAQDALRIADVGDLELALGNQAHLLDNLDNLARDEMLWEALDLPEVRRALRAMGNRVVALDRDVTPNGTPHRSFLFLEQ